MRRRKRSKSEQPVSKGSKAEGSKSRRSKSQPSGRKRQTSRPQTVRVTGTGLWFVLLALVVAVAATNTGNNALFMVLALMLGMLVVSGLVSRWNVRGLRVELREPGEVYAQRPASLRFKVTNRSWWLPRWLLLFSLEGHDRPRLIPYLPRRGRSRGELELLIPTRGIHQLTSATVTSLFPFGLFTKAQRYSLDSELLVYPELFDAAGNVPRASGSFGEEGSSRRGRGYELHQLRAFQPGDDPRDIHWKQTAKTGRQIFVEREDEEARRLSILLDNGFDADDEDKAAHFERLVSEAATAACEHLEQGYEVELVTRDRRLPFATGRRQRFALLEVLALVQAVPPESEPLQAGDARAPELRLVLDRRVAA